MRVVTLALTCLCAVSCTAGGTDSGTDTDSTSGACGEVTVWDLTVIGKVVDQSGAPVGDALVDLEDRGWNTGTILGSASTDTGGLFSLDAVGVTSVEGCWGIVLDYVLVATEGERSGSRGVNSYLYDALDDGTLVADISSFPLVID